MARVAVMGVLLAAALLFWLIPVEREQQVDWAWSEAPPGPTRYPHPAAQLAAEAPESHGVWISRFLDLGGSSRLIAGPSAGGERLYVRSARKARSFRIAAPDAWDRAAVSWSAWDKGYRARRYLQVAVVGGSPTEKPRPLAVRYRTGRGLLVPVGLVGIAVATFGWSRVRSLLPRPGVSGCAAVGLVLLMALVTARLWSRGFVDRDEALLINATREVVAGHWAVREFRYPQSLAYLNALGAAGLSFARAATGRLAYHDPVSNQLFFDGVPFVGRALFDPDNYPLLYFEESLGVLRKGYVLLASLLVLAVGAWGRAVGGDRVGLWAALSLAVQPLLYAQASYILPNVPKALVAVAVVLFIHQPMRDGRRLLFAAALVGFGTSFKYSPVLLLLFLPLALFDRPVRSRLLTLAISAAGLALGFLLACPSAVVHPGHFITMVSREAHHYAFLGHASFDADAPGPAMLHNLYIRAPYWGNFLLAALAAAGTVVALVRGISAGRYRETWLLIGAPALSLAFLFSQFVQFGRNYLPFVAFACVLAGLGANEVLGFLTRAWPSHPRRVWALGTATAFLILSVGSECLTGSGLWGDPPNARAQAVAWVNGNAPLGSRVLIVEPSLGMLDSATVDGARFRVRRPAEVPGLRATEFDFVLGAGELGELKAIERRSFEGPGSFGLPKRYTVARVEAGEHRAKDLAARRVRETAAAADGDEPE